MADTLLALAQAEITTASPRSSGIRGMIAEEHPIMDFIQWERIPQGTPNHRWFEESALPSAAYRAINGGYDADYGKLIPYSEPVAILGGEVIIDRAIPNLYGNDLGDIKARQYEMKARAAARQFEVTWFNGDVGVDANSFDGFRVRAVERNQEYDLSAATVEGELTLAELDQLFDAVISPTCVHLNQFLRRKVNALMRAAGQAREMVGGEFGRQYETYAGVPLVVQQRRNDMTSVLSFVENPGDGGDDAASIYIPHYGGADEDQAVVGILGFGGAWEVYDLADPGQDFQANPQVGGRLEVYVGMAVHGNRALVRGKGIGQI